MEDIAPALLDSIREEFTQKITSDPLIKALYEKISGGGASYVDAEEYAYQIGEALSQAFGKYIVPDALPDGRMYYNIADRVLRPMLEEDHEIVADAAATVQKHLNEKAGIGIKVQAAEVNTDRIDGIIDKVSNAEAFEDVAWVLDEPVKNFSMNVVDETIRKNVEFHGKAGLRPKIIRKAERKCCEWCRNLAGEYDYPDLPHDVYRRHENCRCIVEYDPGEGKRQNVHTKKWTEPGEGDKIEERKRQNVDNLNIFRPNEYRQTIKNYVSVDTPKVLEAAKAGRKHGHGGVYYDAVRKNKKQLQKSIISRITQVERHADKIANPEAYVADWAKLSPQYKEGLIKKWKKDMRRNAEQAEIDLAVFDERYGK